MKRIIAINRRNRVALFEAGVTFDQLAPLAKENGLRAMLPLMPRSGKSALAAYLDREPTIYPKYQWDLADPLLCLEAVYGTGDLFRTGSAAGPGEMEEQWLAGEFQKSPMGPGQNDWMRIIQGAQGGIAVATWCSAKCEVLPEAERLFVGSTESLDPLIEAGYRLLYRNLTDIHFIVDKNAMVNLVSTTVAEREQALKEAGEWNLIYSISALEHFPQERMAYLARESEKELASRGVTLGKPPLVSEKKILDMLLNPNPPADGEKDRSNISWRDRPRGAHRSVFFQTTMDRASSFMSRFDDLSSDAGIEPDRIGRYIQPQLGGRCCHIEFIVSADPESLADIEKIDDFCQGVAAPLIEAGAFFSRPHGSWAEPAMKRASTSFLVYQRMKDIFDPDHVLAPGRLMLGGASDGQA